MAAICGHEVPEYYVEQLPEIELPASDSPWVSRTRHHVCATTGSPVRPRYITHQEVILQSTYFR